MRGRASSAGRFSRPRSAWAALVTAVLLCALVVGGVLLPVLGLIGAADATTVGYLDVPVGAITASIVISYLIAVLLLGATFLSRNAVIAWITATAAVIATLVGSLWPLVATAFSSVDQAQDVIPFIMDLIGRITGQV